MNIQMNLRTILIAVGALLLVGLWTFREVRLGSKIKGLEIDVATYKSQAEAALISSTAYEMENNVLRSDIDSLQENIAYRDARYEKLLSKKAVNLITPVEVIDGDHQKTFDGYYEPGDGDPVAKIDISQFQQTIITKKENVYLRDEIVLLDLQRQDLKKLTDKQDEIIANQEVQIDKLNEAIMSYTLALQTSEEKYDRLHRKYKRRVRTQRFITTAGGVAIVILAIL
jgi:hypothetical protein